jgi:pimeloyl-ACP methyl ester carboxylesterase
MNGDYVDDTVQALSEAGIEGVAAADTDTFSNGTISDAAIGVAAMGYNLPNYNVKLTQSAAGITSSQFNMIGYSYGSLAAAQVADEYSRSGGVVNNLVLVGSPIGKKFLGDLFAQRNIQNTLIVNLRNRGDLIYAGMPHRTLNVISPVIGKQMLQQNGHFYYAPNSQEGQRRRRALANLISPDLQPPVAGFASPVAEDAAT